MEASFFNATKIIPVSQNLNDVYQPIFPINNFFDQPKNLSKCLQDLSAHQILKEQSEAGLAHIEPCLDYNRSTGRKDDTSRMFVLHA